MSQPGSNPASTSHSLVTLSSKGSSSDRTHLQKALHVGEVTARGPSPVTAEENLQQNHTETMQKTTTQIPTRSCLRHLFMGSSGRLNVERIFFNKIKLLSFQETPMMKRKYRSTGNTQKQLSATRHGIFQDSFSISRWPCGITGGSTMPAQVTCICQVVSTGISLDLPQVWRSVSQEVPWALKDQYGRCLMRIYKELIFP